MYKKEKRKESKYRSNGEGLKRAGASPDVNGNKG